MTTQKQRSSYLKKHGSWGRLKKWLSNASGYKCWYCEAKSTRASFDVDHFRPKLGVTVNGVLLEGHAGYYWLAYEWSNFRLACQRCNRPENSETDNLHGKANEFPIQDEAHRCKSSAGLLASELPKLLDPCLQADCALLADGIDGEVKPAASIGTWEFERAKYTIERLGFNEWNTPESKRSAWQTLALLIAAVGMNTNQDVIDELKKYLSNDHEYSSFYRSAIGTHRDKAWVEALL
ncbi:hypothetical protein [Rhodanobacter sp. L36]|uniref:hypothetical protein n=1 Tax=Rhodanobacter sp. L36 TaxID=1747221 RepID=UPI00131C6E8D|nr:hypothetical protein [Rhodanobacter sp. L36]